MSEKIDLYDDLRHVVGCAEYREPLPQKTNKLFVHVWFVNNDGLFLLQQRVATTHRYANKWSQTGGCVRSGESSFDCAKREAFEELNITANPDKAILIGTVKNSDNFFDVWLMFSDVARENMVLQPDEVQNAKWVTVDEIRHMNDDDLLTPAMIPELTMILRYADLIGGDILNCFD